MRPGKPWIMDIFVPRLVTQAQMDCIADRVVMAKMHGCLLWEEQDREREQEPFLWVFDSRSPNLVHAPTVYSPSSRDQVQFPGRTGGGDGSG